MAKREGKTRLRRSRPAGAFAGFLLLFGADLFVGLLFDLVFPGTGLEFDIIRALIRALVSSIGTALILQNVFMRQFILVRVRQKS